MNKIGGLGGTRTHKRILPTDFKSVAYTNSATSPNAYYWWAYRESNSDGDYPRQILSLMRLPIPPYALYIITIFICYFILFYICFSNEFK